MYYIVKQELVKKEVTQEMFVPHIEFVQELVGKGLVAAAGRFEDEKSGGMFILDVETENEALELAQKDPAIVSGILKNEIRPCNLSFFEK